MVPIYKYELEQGQRGCEKLWNTYIFCFSDICESKKSLYEWARVEAEIKRRSHLMALKKLILLKLKVNVVNLDMVKNIWLF